MSCEGESLSSFEALNLKEIGGEFQKEPRISYGRDFLLSLAELDVCKELPIGFDQSILSEMGDAYNSTCEHQKLCSVESLPSGRMSSDSTEVSSERWDSCKLNSKDINSTAKIEEVVDPHKDSRKRYTNQSQQSWKNSGSEGILRSSLQERTGILGKWSAPKLPQGGPEASDLKSKGTEHSLLSRCSEPYRPPAFYKAMSHSGSPNHDSNDETSGSSQGTDKKKARERRWRKASSELTRKEQLKAIEKQKSRPDDQKEKSDPDTSLLLKECPDVLPVLSNNRSPTMYPISGTVEPSSIEAPEKSLKKDSLSHHSKQSQVQQLPSEIKLIRQDAEMVCYEEKLQGQLSEGGRFSALINLKEAENVDPDFIAEANIQANDSSRYGQSITVENAEFDLKKEVRTRVSSTLESKETKINDIPPVSTTGKTSINSSAVEASVSSLGFVKPSYGASNLPEASLALEPKYINNVGKELHKDNTPHSSSSDHSAVRAKLIDGSAEIWQSSTCTKHHDVIVENRDSCKSHSKFVDCSSDSEKASGNMLSWGEKNGKQFEGASTGILMKEILRDGGLSKETSSCAQKAPVSYVSKTAVPDSHSSCTVVGNNCFPYRFSQDSCRAQEPQNGKNVEGVSTGMLIKENLRDRGLSREISSCAQKAPVSDVTKTAVPGDNCFPYGFSHDFHHALEPQKVERVFPRMLMKENLRDQGLAKETSFFARKAPVNDVRKTAVSDSYNSRAVVDNNCFPYGFNHGSRHSQEPQLSKIIRDQGSSCASGADFHSTECSRLNPARKFQKETDSNIEINLPDEDSLITIDDTFILQQDVPAPSPIISSRVGKGTSFPGSGQLFEPERVQQDLSWQDNPWLLQHQVNSGKQFVNSSASQAHLRAPPALQNPWKIHQNDYNPFSAGVVPHPFGQLPIEPRNYEPLIQQYLAPRVQPAESFFPQPNNTLLPEPSIYNHHQVRQIPYYQQEPTPLANLPLNYQRNVNSTMAVGKRGVLGAEENNSALSQLLQMQMRLAQTNVGAVTGSEQRAYSNPIRNRFW